MGDGKQVLDAINSQISGKTTAESCARERYQRQTRQLQEIAGWVTETLVELSQDSSCLGCLERMTHSSAWIGVYSNFSATDLNASPSVSSAYFHISYGKSYGHNVGVAKWKMANGDEHDLTVLNNVRLESSALFSEIQLADFKSNFIGYLASRIRDKQAQKAAEASRKRNTLFGKFLNWFN
jgi:hypothetical protein